MDQRVLPVIKDWKHFEQFLNSHMQWCVLLDFHINFLADLIAQAHAKKKCVIVHMDLIHGLANDPYGAQFLIQHLHCDGIISTKPKAIACAKKHHCLSILRLFLIDSSSVIKGCAMANSVQPDYLEVLPAMTMKAVSIIRAYSELPLIGGGLITSLEDIEYCLDQGMSAVTSSNFSLCENYLNRHGDKV